MHTDSGYCSVNRMPGKWCQHVLPVASADCRSILVVALWKNCWWPRNLQCNVRETPGKSLPSQNLRVVGTMQVAFHTRGGMQVTCAKIVKNQVFEDANRINTNLMPTLHAMVIGASDKIAIISDLPFQGLQNMLDT